MTTKHCIVLLALAALLLVTAATAQSSPLTITDGPRVEYVGHDKAEIAWTTSTGGSSVIRYGTNPNSLNQTAQSAYSNSDASPAGQHAVHRVTVKNLQPNTTYYFMVDSGQGQGTGTEAKSSIGQFTTKPEGGGQTPGGGQGALQITDGPRVEYTSRDTAEIAWTTSTGGSSIVHYGTDPNNLSQTAQNSYNSAVASGQHVTHRVRITGLQPNTTYYFAVDSGQGQGSGTEVKSPVAQFKTK
jgi:phosphodiesterase/alkaline phosphatase D-like protein